MTELAERAQFTADGFDLRERPSVVLPDPETLIGTVVPDVETSGLYVDEGHRVAAVGLAYRTDPDTIRYHAFAFDQGRAEDKGFATVLIPDTPTNAKRGLVGLPAGDPHNRWDWDTDYNLDESEWRYLMEWLTEAGKLRGLTNHNLKFDLLMLEAGTRHWAGARLEQYAKWDTMLANPPLWPAMPTNALKAIGATLFGEDEVAEADLVKEALVEAKKRYGLDGKRYDLIPWEVNGPYAAQDTVLALRLAEQQELRIDEGRASGARINRAVDVMRVLTRAERRGFGPYDVQRSTEIADRIDQRIADLKSTLPFSPQTAAQAAKYFYDDLGMSPWKSDLGETPRSRVLVPDTRKNAPEGATREKLTQGDTSAAVVRRMAEAGVPHAEAWAEITELRIVNQMFYRGYADLAGPDARIRTVFKQAFVRSGRLSVERWQAQAMPKKLGKTLNGEPLPEPRSLFGIRPGYRRMNLDLGQAELRIASHLCGCTPMSSALVTGADFHSQTTTRVFGHTDTHPEWKLFRDIGKRLTFASIFQVGAKRFRETLWDEAGIEWSFNETRSAIYAWRNQYPQFGEAYHYWLEFAERNGYVPLVNGQPSWLLGPRDYPNTAWNRVVQGSLAQFTNEWLVAVEKRTARYNALVLTVHDSVVLELPEDIADEVCAELVEMTEQMWFDYFGIPGKVDSGPW